ncbi:MJ1255/VC2487 family glycosyltransferase [uncultured Shewanella sp.]|uniref:MJ1255/VC2487 family glycosyltransferase n=1 Tax=uncultured Shewanella sp. TaxID=173975 RepID=UPI0026175607|nr:MJ1255/VC2487 family glycosyltransferase [uncultured Shewanella sp.]
MRILYGVQGTGNGHVSRARVMAKAFIEKGIKVDYLFSGRGDIPFFEMALFGDYQTQKGLTFTTQNGRVNLSKTFKNNSLLSINREISHLDLTPYDLVISDFEPITAWAARKQGVASIGINHQLALRYPVPKLGDSWLGQCFLNNFAPVDIPLACHWHHFGFPILPPIVDVIPSAMELSQQVVVYLPFEHPQSIIELIAPFEEYQFIVYHPISMTKVLPDHVKWQSLNGDLFKRDVACCAGVISNAGFELPSEALMLGKKLLVKPLHGQFEQLSNMAALALLGAADCMMKLDKDVVRRWLKSASREAINYPPLGECLVDWIISGNWNEIASLCQSVWQEVRLPETWQKKSVSTNVIGDISLPYR